ncbi:MAG: alpha/beta hydrolase, partial [Anaerolineales bacterium]|nr:alpha/beta hydrolase [Anaerolineales bacterium]
ITPDLRGFGQSEVVESQYKIADMAADTAGLLDQLGIEKAAIAGHSMGGYVALAFARAYPERVLGLGLVASQSPADPPERKQGRYDAAAEIMKTGVESVAESMSAKLTPDERVQAFVRGLIAKQQPAGLANALKAMAERDDSTSVLSGFKFPVAIVHGEVDELIPIQRAQEIKAAIPHAVLRELSGIGHMPMLENPQATATTLKNLL